MKHDSKGILASQAAQELRCQKIQRQSPGSQNAMATYFAAHTGERYRRHVTIGVGTIDYLNRLVAAPFPAFTFSAVGMSVYQFGNFGTAARLLRPFKLTA